MRKILSLILCVLLSGCALPPSHPTADIKKATDIEETGLQKTLKTPVVEVSDELFFGSVLPLEMTQDQLLPSAFRKKISIMSKQMRLYEVAGQITALTGMPVALTPRDKKDNILDPEDEKATPLDKARTNPMALAYEGTIEGLLDAVVTHFGIEWEYIPKNNSIQFLNLKTRTFNIVSTNGSWTYDGVISNTIQPSGDSAAGGGVATQDVNTSGTQVVKNKIEINFWEKTTEAVESMLSKDGECKANPSTGTIVVTDRSGILNNIEKYIEKVNARLAKQVAIQIRVYTLESSELTNHNLSAEAVLKDIYSIGLSSTTGTPIPLNSNAGSLTTLILPGNHRFEGSKAIISALEQHGKIAQVAKGAGVTLNNQPLPIQDLYQTTYLAKTAVTVEEKSSTTELIPGQITTGFAATFIPNIQDNNQVILQYTLNLSTLTAIKSIDAGEGENVQRIELPEVSTRSFHQRFAMPLNSTLVMAGFELEEASSDEGTGVLSYGYGTKQKHRLVVIAIDVRAMPGVGI